MGGIWEINQNSKEIRSKLVWVPPFLDDLGNPELKNIKLDFDIGTEL